MGIQVISSTLQAASANAAAGSAPAADGASGFSDLLALQMLPPDLVAPGADKLVGETKADSNNATEDNTNDTAALNAVIPDANVVAQTLAWFPAQNLPAAPAPTAPHKDLPDLANGAIGEAENGKNGQQNALAQLSASMSRLSDVPPKVVAEPSTAGTEVPAFANILADTGNRDKAPANLAEKLIETPNAPPLSPHGLQIQAAKQTQAGILPPAVQAPLHDGRWASDFGQKIVWMAKADQQDAQININPPELGPVQITLNLKGDNASATFASPHAEVRQALESAMPRLREMMAEAGIALGQTNVGSQFAQQTPQENRQPPSDSPRFAVDNAILSSQSGVAATATTGASRGQGLVDLFA